jgi:hypothetical protein
MNKLAKILNEECLVRTAVNRKFLQAVYKEAIENIIKGRDRQEEALALAEDSDAFWTDTLDEIRYAQRSGDEEELLSAIHAALIDVGDRVETYMSNSRNFHPGYKAPKMKRWQPSEDDRYLMKFRKML